MYQATSTPGWVLAHTQQACRCASHMYCLSFHCARLVTAVCQLLVQQQHCFQWRWSDSEVCVNYTTRNSPKFGIEIILPSWKATKNQGIKIFNSKQKI